MDKPGLGLSWFVLNPPCVNFVSLGTSIHDWEKNGVMPYSPDEECFLQQPEASKNLVALPALSRSLRIHEDQEIPTKDRPVC